MHTIYTEQEEIDIVARALSKINFLDGGTGDDGFDDCPASLKEFYRKVAKDAIASARSGNRP